MWSIYKTIFTLIYYASIKIEKKSFYLVHMLKNGNLAVSGSERYEKLRSSVGLLISSCTWSRTV